MASLEEGLDDPNDDPERARRVFGGGVPPPPPGGGRSERCIEPGLQVAFRLRVGAAPWRSFAGLVGAVDEHGVRVTVANLAQGRFAGPDLFVPWDSIESALMREPGYTPSVGELASWVEILRDTAPGEGDD